MRQLHFSFYQKHATRISVCVIAVSKSQESIYNNRTVCLTRGVVTSLMTSLMTSRFVASLMTSLFVTPLMTSPFVTSLMTSLFVTSLSDCLFDQGSCDVTVDVTDDVTICDVTDDVTDDVTICDVSHHCHLIGLSRCVATGRGLRGRNRRVQTIPPQSGVTACFDESSSTVFFRRRRTLPSAVADP